MEVDKQKEQIALSVLEQNTQANAVWISFDNQAFLSEESAEKHHVKHNTDQDPTVFFREGTQDENISEEDFKAIIEDQGKRLDAAIEARNRALEHIGILEPNYNTVYENNLKLVSEIQEKDSKIEDISALNLEKDEKIEVLEKENETLKARILQLETEKPETLKDEGNTPKKSK
ncbi:hypothetical protein [Algoriella sp.]|uniref:hypothetical protein n=1 Tax=Algoriella sp. TaxID=1872434 RepID=UPI002FCB0982